MGLMACGTLKNFENVGVLSPPNNTPPLERDFRQKNNCISTLGVIVWGGGVVFFEKMGNDSSCGAFFEQGGGLKFRGDAENQIMQGTIFSPCKGAGTVSHLGSAPFQPTDTSPRPCPEPNLHQAVAVAGVCQGEAVVLDALQARSRAPGGGVCWGWQRGGHSGEVGNGGGTVVLAVQVWDGLGAFPGHLRPFRGPTWS